MKMGVSWITALYVHTARHGDCHTGHACHTGGLVVAAGGACPCAEGMRQPGGWVVLGRCEEGFLGLFRSPGATAGGVRQCQPAKRPCAQPPPMHIYAGQEVAAQAACSPSSGLYSYTASRSLISCRFLNFIIVPCKVCCVALLQERASGPAAGTPCLGDRTMHQGLGCSFEDRLPSLSLIVP